MTQKEIKKFLDNTKVYVNGKSKEIQKMLFSFGYGWNNSNPTKISFENRPFLFIYKDGEITCGYDMYSFVEHKNREITADEILSLEITGTSYRPFKDKYECWEEMQKHQPIGWLIEKVSETPIIVQDMLYNSVYISDVPHTYEESMRMYTFDDGAPFGVKY